LKPLLQGKRAAHYAKNTVRLIRAALSTVLSDAVEDEIIDVNPAKSLSRKNRKQAGALTKPEQQEAIRPMDWGQLATFRATVRPIALWGPLFELLPLTGLRPSEALALQPGDIDFGNGVLRVERAVSGGRLKSPKDNETRSVHLNADAVTLLRQHLAWLTEQTLRRGWGEPQWLFPSEAHTLLDYNLDYNNAAKVFHRLVRRAGLPRFRVYDLRHTFASLLLSAGVPLLYVSQQMGHSNPTTTLRYYAHWVQSGDQRWVDVFNQGLPGGARAHLEPDSGTKNPGAVEAPGFIGEP